MKLSRSLIAVTTAAAAILSTTTAIASPAPRATFDSTVRIGNCSGAFIRFHDQLDTDEALVLTNGHCVKKHFTTGTYYVKDLENTKVSLYRGDKATHIGTLSVHKLDYATMTISDVAVFRTGLSYAELRSQFGVEALPLAASEPAIGTEVDIPSGYWRRVWSCPIQSRVPLLMEDTDRYTNVLRLQNPGCELIPGTSGSPVISRATGEIVAINSTSNRSGDSCTLNNPCEVHATNSVTSFKGANYATQTALLNKCFTKGHIDLSKRGCTLPGGANAQKIPFVPDASVVPLIPTTGSPSPAVFSS